jgi:heme exporter protein A
MQKGQTRDRPGTDPRLALLQASELECERGGRRLFHGLSFALGAGEALRIAGPNGSGKTSLVRILAGLLPPTQGTVLWKGEPIARLREDYSKKLVYLGHSAAVKDELTAGENLAIACRLAGDPTPAHRMEQALERFGLAGVEFPLKRLSQGQRRRAALARLALSEAKPLWLLDEPFSALDADGVSLLDALLVEHAKRGGALVFTTHQDPGIAATRMIELGRGLQAAHPVLQ